MKLQLLQELVDDLNSSNSTLDKTAVLENEKYNDDFIKKALVATYHPFKQYYVTSANLKKRSDLIIKNEYTLFELLDLLSDRKITGHEALGTVNGFIQNHPEHEELVLNILDRNLKTRTTSTIINKSYPNLIPTFDVTLAKPFEKHEKKVKFDKDDWYASRKLDGVRCVGIVDFEGQIEFKSREGNPFETLEVLRQEIEKLNLKGIVFDGEVCMIDENGNENFQGIMKLIKKKDFTIPNPKYLLFDMIDLNDFNNKSGKLKLSHRLSRLKGTVTPNNFLSIVEQERVESFEHLSELNAIASNNGWEGMMVRKDIGYEGKRSDKLLKCKKFFDNEYVVKDVVMGDMRIIVGEEGDKKEITREMLSKVIIEHKGHEVGVGSGFSLNDRMHYYNHPEEIIGKQITVQYFEETKNQNGGISLRFPTVKFIYKEGNRDV